MIENSHLSMLKFGCIPKVYFREKLASWEYYGTHYVEILAHKSEEHHDMQSKLAFLAHGYPPPPPIIPALSISTNFLPE